MLYNCALQHGSRPFVLFVEQQQPTIDSVVVWTGENRKRVTYSRVGFPVIHCCKYISWRNLRLVIQQGSSYKLLSDMRMCLGEREVILVADAPGTREGSPAKDLDIKSSGATPFADIYKKS